jgi:3-hydroxyisobutyrate dehydrogenase
LTDAPKSAGPVGFIGLGMMGLPMAKRLVGAGFTVRGSDLSAEARAAFAAAGGEAFTTGREAATGCGIVITMLPDGGIVRDALLGSGGVAEVLAKDALVVDMSSSAPVGTQSLGSDLAAKGIALIDAPVSGGVRRAIDGSLAIMAGGEAAAIERARPLLEAMGKSIFATGPVGSGHAVKALNNYVSAAGLAAACEAVLVADKFGVDPATLVDVLNASTGKNNSTDLKLKPFVLSRTFGSGFSMALMAKDLRTAADLAEAIEIDTAGLRRTADMWAEASKKLGRKADHTEIHRFLAGESGELEKGA